MANEFNSNLFLTVQTDGDGSSCGYDYKQRCVVARGNDATRFRLWAEMVRKADCTIIKLDGEPATLGDFLQAVADLDAYYTQHVKDINGGK